MATELSCQRFKEWLVNTIKRKKSRGFDRVCLYLKPKNVQELEVAIPDLEGLGYNVRLECTIGKGKRTRWLYIVEF